MSPKYSDPLSEAIKPPADETAEEEEARLKSEEEASRTSQEIDEFLKQERLAKKKKGTIRLLLLGQSESGGCLSIVPCSSIDLTLTGVRKVDYPQT
jgi:guanine nucleotide-binding protein subunit alpha